ncbi:hypothetical protein [Frondihabitans australicus]|uniref:Uncharacterized protein n=1 Tax=Frondihabitans australicus TaxID=386892 RepID=A0A495IK39_9MICO|nr:hypothetical protein [Frondihabitans australicus]RKR76090.1 hypothetical protein C8E83_3255 [Frondihabitans australicus]
MTDLPTARGDGAGVRTGTADGYGSDGWSPVPDSLAATSPTWALPGHVSIAPRVITRVSGAVVGEALDIDRRDVRVEAYDDSGRLGLRVWTPVGISPLAADADVPAGGVLGLLRELQATVATRLLSIADREVSRVDVTVTGSTVERPSTRRVR